jgi:cytochrome c-type biogenesis protein CcmH
MLKLKTKLAQPGFRAVLLTALLTIASVAQTTSGMLTPDIERVGMKLACLCGGCNNTVGNCPMIGCHYTAPARDKIAAMQKAGADDKTIIDAFVSQEGLKALAAPPTQGFSLVGWVMPFIAIAGGLLVVGLVLRNMMRTKPAGAPEIDRAVLDRYHDQIEKDTARLDQ